MPDFTVSSDAERKIVAQFAGQGSKYFDNLKRVIRLQNKDATEFLQMAAGVLKEELERIDPADRTKYFSRGLDFFSWVDGGSLPPEIYLQGTPISFPLIFVTQLTNYFVNWSMVNFEEDLVHSAFGHSQGVAAAVIVGLAKDKEEFLSLVRSFTKVMLYIGLHTQKAFDQHANMSYCMLAVLKLPLSTVQVINQCTYSIAVINQ
jgi:malonyl CoA-acyl carrier protein transacylase